MSKGSLKSSSHGKYGLLGSSPEVKIFTWIAWKASFVDSSLEMKNQNIYSILILFKFFRQKLLSDSNSQFFQVLHLTNLFDKIEKSFHWFNKNTTSNQLDKRIFLLEIKSQSKLSHRAKLFYCICYIFEKNIRTSFREIHLTKRKKIFQSGIKQKGDYLEKWIFRWSNFGNINIIFCIALLIDLSLKNKYLNHHDKKSTAEVNELFTQNSMSMNYIIFKKVKKVLNLSRKLFKKYFLEIWSE